MLWDKLSASVENDYIDFKKEWYSKDKLGEVDLVHDILCMSNSLSDSIDRYIVIGVEEDKSNGSKLIHDISKDANCRQSANLIQTLRNYMSVIPNIELIREKVGKGFIDIIKAEDYMDSNRVEITRKMVTYQDGTKHFFYDKYSNCIEIAVDTQIV